MFPRPIRLVAALVALAAAFAMRAPTGQISGPPREALTQTIAFLSKEVPRWHVEEGCYSCHNNGDAARALIAASRAGFDVAAPLGDTLAFLSKPAGWAGNSRGGPSDDQPLARIQFSNALTDAVAAGLAPPGALRAAAALVAADQQDDGSWQLDRSQSVGSPATYGTALATWAARRTLVASGDDAWRAHVARADRWLRSGSVGVTPDAAAILLGLGDASDAEAARQRNRAVAFLLDTQSTSGGWGPYPTVREEAFDTAVALLALAGQPRTARIETAVASGRSHLFNTRLPDGTWLETTRPAGQLSYAQLISTTGWAVLAVLRATEYAGS